MYNKKKQVKMKYLKGDTNAGILVLHCSLVCGLPDCHNEEGYIAVRYQAADSNNKATTTSILV